MRTVVIVSLTGLALAGCGGGGGSSGSSTAPPVMPPPPTSSSGGGGTGASPSPTTTGSGNGSGASPAAAATVFQLQAAPGAPNSGGTLTINPDGTAVFQADGQMANLSPTLQGTLPPALDPGFAGGQRLFQQSGTNAPTFVLERMGAAAGLSLGDFGAWATSQSAVVGEPVQHGAYAGGHDPTMQLPSSGSAIYNGSYVGFMGTRSDTNVSGGVRLQADFGALTISSQFTSGALSQAIPEAATGKVNSTGGYAASFTRSSDTGFQYQMNGQFYGSGATETTGRFSGFAGGAANPFFGAFGAKR